MKKINIIAVLSALLLVGCSSSIEARPDQVKNEDRLVEVKEGETKVDIYNNEFTDLYESLINAGTTNTNVVDEMIQIVAKREIGVTASKANEQYKSFAEKNFITEEKFNQLVDEYMVDQVMSGTYSEDDEFHEEKFAREQREALYAILDNDGSETEENFNAPKLLIPGIKFVDIFGSDKEATEEAKIAKGREKYQEYREKVVNPIIYKQLLTSKYLLENKYKALGRAAARDVRVISLDNSKPQDSGSAIRTLSNYIGGYLYVTQNKIADEKEVSKYFPVAANGEVKFDIDSLARIWKGVYDNKNLTELEANELKFIDGTNATGEKLYTENQETIVDEVDQIAVKNEAGRWELKTGLDTEDSHISELLSKYTGNYTYPVDWGVTLAERAIQIKDIVDDDFIIEKTGLTSLPSTIRNRLFAVNIEKNIKNIQNVNLIDKNGVNYDSGINFLLPEAKENTIIDYTTVDGCLKAAKDLVHYDSSSKTYYVVLVDSYKYSTAEDGLGKELTDKTREKALEVAILLGEDSSHQSDAVTHYFKKTDAIYEICYHDDDFYEYMKSNYPDIFEKDK